MVLVGTPTAAFADGPDASQFDLTWADIVTDTANSPNYLKALTGRTCYNEYYYDGQGIQHLGYRCAQAYDRYIKYNSSLYRIDDYYIRYDVSSGLSYGAHNNENPWRIKQGFNSGTASWLSPDSGNANVGYFRRDQGTTYTYIGGTVNAIDAYADIPSVSDPDLHLETATF
jgi:hypothetical protein